MAISPDLHHSLLCLFCVGFTVDILKGMRWYYMVIVSDAEVIFMCLSTIFALSLEIAYVDPFPSIQSSC